MHFAITYAPASRFPTVAELVGPPLTAAELATRAAVTIALIDRKLNRPTAPNAASEFQRIRAEQQRRNAGLYGQRARDDRYPPGAVETVMFPGARVLSIR